MTQETDHLQKDIDKIKNKLSEPANPLTDAVGYNTTVYILTDLLGCIFVGLGIGVFFQKVLGTSILLTAILTLLGGIAGLWTVTRYGMRLQTKQEKFQKEHPEPLKPVPDDFDEEDFS